MASENLQLKNSCADHHEEISSPVLRVLQVNDRGMVFESRNDFEIGDIIELGFHVKYFAGPNQPEGRVERTEFITAHGVIVSSMLCASADGNLVHEVAMLFHEMDRRDSRALRRFTEMEGQRKSLGQEHGPEEDAVSGMIGMNQGFRACPKVRRYPPAEMTQIQFPRSANPKTVHARFWQGFDIAGVGSRPRIPAIALQLATAAAKTTAKGLN